MKSIIVKIKLIPLNNPNPKTPNAYQLQDILNCNYYPYASIKCEKYKHRKVGVCRCEMYHPDNDKYCFSCGKRVGGAK